MEARVGPQRRREAMPNVFDFTSPPFDRLRPREVERVERAVDVVFLRQGERVLARGAMPDHVYVLIKGLVEERDGDEVVTLHEPGELFDASVLLHKACRHEFVVREEAICYRLPIEDFLELTANNPSFAAFFLEDISHRLESLAQRTAQPGSVGALTVRVSDALIHPPVFVPPGTSLHEAALRMDETDQQALLLEDDGRTGIVTGVDLVRAGVRDRRPLETPVREVARFDLVGVGEDEFLFEAALLMTRARVRHLVVRRAGEIVGVLDAANVLSSMANRAATVANLIDRAAGPPELAEAGERIAALVRQLHTAGTKIGFVTEISTELQRRLTARIFGLLAPEGLADRACLVVMGSEGRGESLLATDQDNGLILADGVEPEPLQGFRRRLVEALVTVGFPLCPGDIMVTNPKWAKPEAAWRDDLRRAVLEPGEQALMDVATLVDAAPVAGRADLLERVKAHLFDLLADNQAFHARFALAIEAFGQGTASWAACSGAARSGSTSRRPASSPSCTACAPWRWSGGCPRPARCPHPPPRRGRPVRQALRAAAHRRLRLPPRPPPLPRPGVPAPAPPARQPRQPGRPDQARARPPEGVAAHRPRLPRAGPPPLPAGHVLKRTVGRVWYAVGVTIRSRRGRPA